MPSADFPAARAVVNAVDAVGLIDMGAPDDEYDGEVEDLTKWREPVTAQRVAEVFLHWFGDSGRMSETDAVRIAEGVNAARAAHLPQ